MKRVRLFVASLLAAAANLATAATVTIQLPADVSLLGVDVQNSALEIRLPANAVQHRVGLPPLSALRIENGACIVRVPFTGEAPAFQVLASASGDVTIGFAPVAAIAAAPAPVAPPSGTFTPAPPASTPTPAFAVVAPQPVVSTVSASAAPSPPAVFTPNAGAAAAPAPSVTAPAALVPQTIDPELEAQIEKFFPPLKFDPIARADYALPESPAAAALGGTSSLLRPATPRQLVTSLLTHFDQNGRLQSGFAVAVTPYTMLRARPLTADEYDASAMQRFFANLQLSVAAKPDDTLAAGAVRGSAGLSLLFFDAGDLRRDRALLSRINAALKRTGGFSDTDFTGATTPAALPAQNLATAAQLWDQQKAANWNKASAGLGVAPLFFTANGRLDELRHDGVALWLSWAQPGPGSLARSTQFILGGNARLNQHTSLAPGARRNDTVDLGAQIRFGSADFNGFVEGLFRERTPATGPRTRNTVYEVGLEKRLQNGLWLNLSWSNQDPVTGDRIVRSGLRYGFGNKAVLANPAQ